MSSAQKIAEQLHIGGLLNNSIGKKQFKCLVKAACREENDEYIVNEINKYKKMKIMREETTKNNNYFKTVSLQNGRALFKYRSEMYPAKLNYKNDAKFKKEKFLCDSCETE